MRTLIVAAALAAMTSPAIAQNTGGGLVAVNISNNDVLNNSLNRNELELLSRNNVAIPVTVQVPIGIAANVCPNVNAGVLAKQLKQTGKASCTATSGSRALGQQVLRQTLRGNR